MKNGVPFEIAFNMNPDIRLAMSITFSEMEGSEFDFDNWQFKERKE